MTVTSNFTSKTIQGAVMILLIFLTAALPTACFAEAKRLFRIGTGGVTGVYYPIGRLIAQGLTDTADASEDKKTVKTGVPGLIGVAQNSAGSVENIRNIASGGIEAGLVQADVAAWAFQADQVFEKNDSVRSVRAVASLYSEKFQIVVRRDAGIRSVSDIRGKRFSIDEIGSGTLSVMRIILNAHGLSEKDFFPVYLKPVFTQDKMIIGDLQGFVMMAGAPMEAVTLLYNVGITLVPISKQAAERINSQYPYLVPGVIPAGVYTDIPETPTLEVHALLLVSSALNEKLVYQITEALWSERTLSLLKQGHPQGQFITPETALSGISIPLHPGAQRFYQEHGFLQKDAGTK